jgi:hypothetical protein
MKTVAEQWASYRMILPADAGTVQISETKQAFYAGAQAVIGLLTDHATFSLGDDVTDADVDAFGAIVEELLAFGRSKGARA